MTEVTFTHTLLAQLSQMPTPKFKKDGTLKETRDVLQDDMLHRSGCVTAWSELFLHPNALYSPLHSLSPRPQSFSSQQSFILFLFVPFNHLCRNSICYYISNSSAEPVFRVLFHEAFFFLKFRRSSSIVNCVSLVLCSRHPCPPHPFILSLQPKAVAVVWI